MLCAIASEENAELVRVSAAFPRGDYMLVFDPLDGSSNIDVNINVGTISPSCAVSPAVPVKCSSMKSSSPVPNR